MLVMNCETYRRVDVLLNFCESVLQKPRQTIQFSSEVCTLMLRAFRMDTTLSGYSLVWDIVEHFELKVDEILYTSALSSCKSPPLLLLGQRVHTCIQFFSLLWINLMCYRSTKPYCKCRFRPFCQYSKHVC
jgi:hypothetical protein